MRSGSIFAGRFFGVEIRIHLTFFFLLLFVLWIDSSHSGTIDASRVLGLVAIIFASVLVHEFGHVVAAGRLGVNIRGVMLLPIGGMAVADPHEHFESGKNAVKETRISFAGPAVSAALALFSGAMLLQYQPLSALWVKPFLTTHDLPRSFFWVNVFLFALNLLPAFPLDGGRVLRAWLARRIEFQKATRQAVTIGHIFAALFMLVGTLWTPWLTLTGLFMFMAAQIEERTVLFQSVVETVQIDDIMLREFSTLSPADTLEDALDKAVHSLQDDFPVVRGGDLVGVINRHTIVDQLRKEGNGYVQGAMNRAFEIAARTESLSSAFRKLTARGLTLIPVVDQERLVGIVTLQNLMHSMGLLAESRRLRRQMEETQI
ncbi:MAG TPA: site-2 protease family protein [Candidatus Angelobacter sp.]|nr:site-2 protease family protein [Candidatus Angelobacter sp.]